MYKLYKPSSLPAESDAAAESGKSLIPSVLAENTFIYILCKVMHSFYVLTDASNNEMEGLTREDALQELAHILRIKNINMQTASSMIR